MKKTILAGSALAAAVLMAAPASAAIYHYDTYIGNGIGKAKLTIDTSTGKATYKGKNINVTMTGSTIKNFKGGAKPAYQYMKVDDISGTFTRYGRSYTAYPSTSPKHTSFAVGFDNRRSTPENFLWTYGKDKWGRRFDFDGKGWNSTSSTSGGSSGGSTSTGGSTSGGATSTGGSSSGGSTSTGGSSSGGSTGGTPVPAPGALLLFGLGAGALALRRRKKS